MATTAESPTVMSGQAPSVQGQTLGTVASIVFLSLADSNGINATKAPKGLVRKQRAGLFIPARQCFPKLMWPWTNLPFCFLPPLTPAGTWSSKEQTLEHAALGEISW